VSHPPARLRGGERERESARVPHTCSTLHLRALMAVHSCCIRSGHCCSCVSNDRTSCSSAADRVGGTSFLCATEAAGSGEMALLWLPSCSTCESV